MPSAANVSHEREREREREKDWLDVDALDEGRAVCGELRLANTSSSRLRVQYNEFGVARVTAE